jgi:predicted acyltransferase
VKHRRIPYIIVGLLVGYFLLLLFGNGFVYGRGNILAIVDHAVLGPNHLLNDRGIDPEGVLSQIPAMAHVMIGFCCGRWLMEKTDLEKKMLRLLLLGLALAFGGYLLSYGCPISKKAWSPTFVMVTCGLAAGLLALLIWIIDVKGHKAWCRPFETFGVNPLFVYVLSELGAVTLDNISLSYQGRAIDLHSYTDYVLLQPVLGGYGASLAYALLFVIICWAVGKALQKNGIYIKI